VEGFDRFKLFVEVATTTLAGKFKVSNLEESQDRWEQRRLDGDLSTPAADLSFTLLEGGPDRNLHLCFFVGLGQIKNPAVCLALLNQNRGGIGVGINGAFYSAVFDSNDRGSPARLAVEYHTDIWPGTFQQTKDAIDHVLAHMFLNWLNGFVNVDFPQLRRNAASAIEF